MVDFPVPDELCPHVEAGAEITGGWYFAASDPPKAVGMCHECMVWCREHFEPGTPWSEVTETDLAVSEKPNGDSKVLQ